MRQKNWTLSFERSRKRRHSTLFGAQDGRGSAAPLHRIKKGVRHIFSEENEPDPVPVASLLLLFLGVFPEKLGNAGLAHLALRNSEGSLDQDSVGDFYLDSVEFEKHQCRRGTNPFVSIYKRVVLDEMEEIRRCHLEKVRVKVILVRNTGSIN